MAGLQSHLTPGLCRLSQASAPHATCWVQREQLLKDLGAKLREARAAAQTAKPAAATWEGSFAPFLSALKAFALTRASEPELVGPLPVLLQVRSAHGLLPGWGLCCWTCDSCLLQQLRPWDP